MEALFQEAQWLAEKAAVEATMTGNPGEEPNQ
jgi:hypothetical protein